MITPQKIIRSKRKTIALVVNNRAEFIVRAPFGVSEKVIYDFISRKEHWIESKQKEVRAYFEKYPKCLFEVGESHLYLGKNYILDFSNVGDVFLEGNKMILPKSNMKQAKDILIKWYMRQGQKLIKERADFYANKMGATYTSLSLSNAKSRWGSCSPKQNIRINWRVIMCPQFVIDYVIVHELSHLQFKNHGKEFWTRVETIMPDYKEAQRWLRANSALASLY